LVVQKKDLVRERERESKSILLSFDGVGREIELLADMRRRPLHQLIPTLIPKNKVRQQNDGRTRFPQTEHKKRRRRRKTHDASLIDNPARTRKKISS